jgi:hypothetical protein
LRECGKGLNANWALKSKNYFHHLTGFHKFGILFSVRFRDLQKSVKRDLYNISANMAHCKESGPLIVRGNLTAIRSATFHGLPSAHQTEPAEHSAILIPVSAIRK